MSDAPHYRYHRRSSPFLPLAEGEFHFLHTSTDRVRDIAVRRLRIVPLGTLAVPSGQLVLADPFVGMRREGNEFIRIPPGQHAVYQTVSDVFTHDPHASQGGKGHVIRRVAYLSIVLDHERWMQRREWQANALLNEQSPDVPVQALSLLYPSAEGGATESDDGNPAPLRVQSGSVALVDGLLLAQYMPEDQQSSGTGWYDTVFEHGRPGSWFDAMDEEVTYPRGAANVPLPGAPEWASVVLSQSGWGDGDYPILLERSFDYQDATLDGLSMEDNDEGDWADVNPEALKGTPVAIHVDFRVLPFDPLNPYGME